MKHILVIFTILFSAVLFGYTTEKTPENESNLILNKWTEPFRIHDSIFPISKCFSDTVKRTYRIIDSADYVIQILPSFSNDTTGHCVSGWFVYVSKAVYDTLKVGDVLPRQYRTDYWDLNNVITPIIN